MRGGPGCIRAGSAKRCEKSTLDSSRKTTNSAGQLETAPLRPMNSLFRNCLALLRVQRRFTLHLLFEKHHATTTKKKSPGVGTKSDKRRRRGRILASPISVSGLISSGERPSLGTRSLPALPAPAPECCNRAGPGRAGPAQGGAAPPRSARARVRPSGVAGRAWLCMAWRGGGPRLVGAVGWRGRARLGQAGLGWAGSFQAGPAGVSLHHAGPKRPVPFLERGAIAPAHNRI